MNCYFNREQNMRRQIIYRLQYSFLMIIISFCSYGQVMSTLQSKVLNEVSGLVISRNNLFFVHNDSGDTSRFFAVNPKGELVATFYFKGDQAIKPLGVADCEDIAAGPGPEIGKNYIYLGDIGDNMAHRPYISVYRLPEPNQPSGNMYLKAEALHLKYPNGPQDAEAMMVDPVLKELIIVSKRQDTVGIYTASLSFNDQDTITLEKEGSLFLPGNPLLKYVVAGDISQDGKQILLKTYEKVFYWLRKDKEPIAQTLSRKPVELPYIQEPQGEAIAFTPDGRGYYCIGEGNNAIIYKYEIRGYTR